LAGLRLPAGSCATATLDAIQRVTGFPPWASFCETISFPAHAWAPPSSGSPGGTRPSWHPRPGAGARCGWRSRGRTRSRGSRRGSIYATPGGPVCGLQDHVLSHWLRYASSWRTAAASAAMASSKWARRWVAPINVSASSAGGVGALAQLLHPGRELVEGGLEVHIRGGRARSGARRISRGGSASARAAVCNRPSRAGRVMRGGGRAAHHR